MSTQSKGSVYKESSEKNTKINDLMNRIKYLDNKYPLIDDVFHNYKKNDYKCVCDNVHMKKLNKATYYSKLPEPVKVSTMTMTCKVHCQINIHNVARFMDLHMDKILSVKYGKHPLNNRSLIPNKKKKKVKSGKKNFYNECTIKIKPCTVPDEPIIEDLDIEKTLNGKKKPKKKSKCNNPINIKLFKNGSLQLTGVKNMKCFLEVIETLFHELKIVKAVIHEGKLVTKPFITDPAQLILHSIKICMINTNFNLKIKIDRDQLYERLLLDKIKCKFEPLTHAGVNIKFQYSADKKISILVFKSGAIIITGATNIDQIAEAYNFIISKIKKYGKKIIFVNIDDLFEDDDLKKYL